jgi:hypothetical protein
MPGGVVSVALIEGFSAGAWVVPAQGVAAGLF